MNLARVMMNYEAVRRGLLAMPLMKQYDLMLYCNVCTKDLKKIKKTEKPTDTAEEDDEYLDFVICKEREIVQVVQFGRNDESVKGMPAFYIDEYDGWIEESISAIGGIMDHRLKSEQKPGYRIPGGMEAETIKRKESLWNCVARRIPLEERMNRMERGFPGDDARIVRFLKEWMEMPIGHYLREEPERLEELELELFGNCNEEVDKTPYWKVAGMIEELLIESQCVSDDTGADSDYEKGLRLMRILAEPICKSQKIFLKE